MIQKVLIAILVVAVTVLVSCADPGSKPDYLSVSISPAAMLLHGADPWPFTVTVANRASKSVTVSLVYTITGPATNVVRSVTGLKVPAGGSVTNTLSGALVDLGIAPGANTVLVRASDGTTTAEISLNPVLKVWYEKIVVDAYNDDDPVIPIASYSTILELYGPAGDTSTDTNGPDYNLWSPASLPSPPPLASDNGASLTRPNSVYGSPGSGYAYIDYTGGLEPGKKYYIRSRMQDADDEWGFAIHVLTAPRFYTPADRAVVMPTTGSGTDSPATGGGGVPTTFTSILLDQPVAKYYTPGGVRWFRLILP